MHMPLGHFYLELCVFVDLELEILHQVLADLLLHAHLVLLTVFGVAAVLFVLVCVVVGVNRGQNGEHYVLPLFLQVEVLKYELLLLGSRLRSLQECCQLVQGTLVEEWGREVD